MSFLVVVGGHHLLLSVNCLLTLPDHLDSLLALLPRMSRMKTLFLILLSYTTILLNPILYTANSFSATTTISITPPASTNDYRQLASLLVSSFDAPQKEDDNASSMIQKLQWDLYEKSLTEEFTYKRYVSTVRRMRGKKYCLLVAKKANVVDEESDGVVGMIEMGMSLCPTVPTNITSPTTDNNDGSSNNNSMTPTPLIGVICVSPNHQNEGIGMKLLHKCEEVAREVWKEEYICVDVEPDNTPALSLFEMGGYEECLDEGGALMRNTTILRRRKAEVRPHLLLRKRIRDDDDYGSNDDDDII